MSKENKKEEGKKKFKYEKIYDLGLTSGYKLKLVIGKKTSEYTIKKIPKNPTLYIFMRSKKKEGSLVLAFRAFKNAESKVEDIHSKLDGLVKALKPIDSRIKLEPVYKDELINGAIFSIIESEEQKLPNQYAFWAEGYNLLSTLVETL